MVLGSHFHWGAAMMKMGTRPCDHLLLALLQNGCVCLIMGVVAGFSLSAVKQGEIDRRMQQYRSSEVLRHAGVTLVEGHEFHGSDPFTFERDGEIVTIQQPVFSYSREYSHLEPSEKTLRRKLEVGLLGLPDGDYTNEEILCQLEQLPYLRQLWIPKPLYDQAWVNEVQRRLPQVEIVYE